jgi:hypothetical protein
MSTGSIDARLRPTQVIIGALCMGIILFGAATAWFVKNGSIPASASDDVKRVLPLAAKGLLFVGITVGWALWRGTRSRAAGVASSMNTDRARDALLQPFQVGIIMRAALVEAPGLLCVVTALITRDLWMLAWGAVAVAGLVAIFPTRGTYERFVQDAVDARTKTP